MTTATTAAVITVGSRAFFAALEDFKQKREDQVTIVPQVSNGWWKHKTTTSTLRLFEWQQHSVAELVKKLSLCTDCKRVTTLLVPAFAAAIRGDMSEADYLAAIAPAIDTLCDRHEWGRTVYKAYKQNGAMTLTEEQLAAAYEEYCKARPNDTRRAKVNPRATTPNK